MENNVNKGEFNCWSGFIFIIKALKSIKYTNKISYKKK